MGMESAEQSQELSGTRLWLKRARGGGRRRPSRRWRLGRRLERRNQHRLSVARLPGRRAGAGAALPARRAGGDCASVSCWVRKDRVYLDVIACRQLRDKARSRWDRLAEEKGRPPRGSTVLTGVYASHRMLALAGIRTVHIAVFEPGNDEEVRVHELEANEDRLFDVTGLGIVQPG